MSMVYNLLCIGLSCKIYCFVPMYTVYCVLIYCIFYGAYCVLTFYCLRCIAYGYIQVYLPILNGLLRTDIVSIVYWSTVLRPVVYKYTRRRISNGYAHRKRIERAFRCDGKVPSERKSWWHDLRTVG